VNKGYWINQNWVLLLQLVLVKQCYLT